MDKNLEAWIASCGAGAVEKKIYSQPVVVWLLRIFFVAFGVWALWHGQHASSLIERVVDYLLLALALWRLAHQGQVQVVLCTKGIVLRRRPLNMRELFESWYNTELLYTYINYEAIVGFNKDWNQVQVMNPSTGGIILMDIELQFVTYSDKMSILNYIKSKNEETQS